ncbi:MAG: universal stress protein [Thermodesulfobacteriota bacterium]
MYHHILLATDGSVSARKAEDFTLNLCFASGAELTVLHVQDDHLCHYGYVDQLVPGETKEGFVQYVLAEQQAAGDRILKEFTRKATTRGIVYKLKVQRGEPAEQIAAIAQQEEVDLVILGGSRAGGRKFFAHHSVVNKVTMIVSCTVMTLS